MSWTFGPNKRSGITYGAPWLRDDEYYLRKAEQQQEQMVRYNTIIRNPGYVAPRRFIGPVRSIAMANRTVARQRLAARGFARGYSRTGGFYGRFGQSAARNGNLPEKKFKDTALSFNFDSTSETASTAGTGQLDLIAQGDTENTRDGRQCTIKSVQIKGTVLLAPLASASAAVVTTMMLIQDTQTNGTQATFSDIFTSTASNLALVNLSNSSRFRILKKWTHTFNPASGVSGAYNDSVRNIDYFKKCNIPLEFSSTTGAITELKSNHIFLAYGAAGSGSDDTVAFAGSARLRFTG